MTTVQAWSTLSRVLVLDTEWMQVAQDSVRQPDGRVGRYDHVLLPASVTVLAVRPGQYGWEVPVTRQWIYTHGGTQWRLPAGGVGPARDAAAAARSELREEVGVAAGRWHVLGQVNGADSATNHVDHLFLAQELSEVPGGPVLEPTEADLTVHWLPLTGVVSMVRRGHILHAGSVAAVLLGAIRLGLQL